jgi:hypothetical protein
MIADRKIDFENRLELKSKYDEQTYDAVYKISIDIKDTILCRQKSNKG